METTLFRYRFGLESHDAQRMLMSEFDLPYKALSHADFESVREKLTLVARSIGQPISKRSYCSLQPPSTATSPSQQETILIDVCNEGKHKLPLYLDMSHLAGYAGHKT